MAEQPGYGTRVRYGIGNHRYDIGGLKAITGPRESVAKIDVTPQTDRANRTTARKFIPGRLLRIGNDVVLTVFLSGDPFQLRLRRDMRDKTVNSWVLNRPTGGAMGFDGIITAVEIHAPQEDDRAVEATYEVSVTGDVWKTIPGEVLETGYRRYLRRTSATAYMPPASFAQLGSNPDDFYDWILKPGNTASHMSAEEWQELLDRRRGAVLSLEKPDGKSIRGDIQRAILVGNVIDRRVYVGFRSDATITGSGWKNVETDMSLVWR